ncbi:MAG: 4-(cytidine 5'-diphospho)-2-C-methyl-D-erythritol kinase [Syntrophorhabdaceae bacterium]|nr:4-(cytidine 5'-diphospho)-2-C-methyl-D-erythritol kinase [Syntrophorhabdaceae bacterium]
MITISSPAKVNLFLKVIGKRADGYHNIVSIVDLVSIFDRITVKSLEEDAVIVNDDRGILPDGMANTIFKAAMLLKERYNIKSGADIFIEKNIPIGSGLGGPSSNGVATIKALIEHWGIEAQNNELFEIAKRIGADCPLFLYGRTCIIEGIGEIITPVELPELNYVIIYPERPLSTKDVYESLKIVLTKRENDIKLSVNFNFAHDVVNILHNDLEKAAITMFPDIIRLKERLLQAGALGSLMSGSGSSVFGIFDSTVKAEEASTKLNDLGRVFTAKSIK